MKIKLIDETIPRFFLVGILNTIVGCGAMFLLYNWANCSYWVSSAANYILGGCLSFFLNKYFTFHQKEWVWGEVLRFVLNVAGCYLLAYGMAKPLVLIFLMGQSPRVQGNAAMLVGMGLYPCLNYLGQRFFTFRKSSC